MEEHQATWAYAAILVSPITLHYLPFVAEVGGLVLNPTRICMLASGVAAARILVQQRQLRVSYTSLGVIMLLLLLILSVTWSLAPKVTARQLVDLSFVLIYFISVIVYLNRDNAFRILLAALLLPAIAVVVYAGLNMLGTSTAWRLTENASRNWVGRDVVALLPIITLTAVTMDGAQAKVRYGLIIVMMIAVPVSGARSGLVALLIGVSLTAVAWARLEKQFTVRQFVPHVLLGSVGLFVGVIVAVKSGVVPARILQIPVVSGGISPEVIGQYRYAIRQAELATIREYPIFGIGYGAFIEHSITEYGLGATHPHGLLTSIWTGAGIMGVSLLTANAVLILRNYSQQIAHGVGHDPLWMAGCMIGLMSIGLAGMFNVVMYQPILYLLLGVGSSATVIE